MKTSLRGPWRWLPVALGVIAAHPASGQAYPTDYRWTTVAGRNSIGSDDGPGDLVRFNYPQAIAADARGNLFVADTGNHTIRRMDAVAGTFSTIAGLAGKSGYVDGPGTNARLSGPVALTAAPDGTVYFADAGKTIRSITAAGAVATVAGARNVSGFQDGAAAAALFSEIRALASGSVGEIYLIDGNYVRRLANGTVSTLLSPDVSLSVTGVGQQFFPASALAVSAGGELYVAGTLQEPAGSLTPCILRRSPAGAWSAFHLADINTIGAVSGITALAVLNDGTLAAALVRSYPGNNELWHFALDGTATSLGRTSRGDGNSLAIPGLAASPAGGFMALRADNAIARHALDGSHQVFAGTPAGSGELSRAASLALDTQGNAWIATLEQMYTLGRPSTSESLIRVSPAGNISTVIGAAFVYDVHYGIPALAAADDFGNAYFIHGMIRMDQLNRIDATGAVVDTSRFLDSVPQPTYPLEDCVIDGAGNFILTETSGRAIWKRTPTGTWSVLAGGGPGQSMVDGSGAGATFSSPTGICRDPSGNFHVLDTAWIGGELAGCFIRRITPAGQVTTNPFNLVIDLVAAGVMERASPSDLSARCTPTDLVVDRHGNYFLAYPAAGVVVRFADGQLTVVGGSLGEHGERSGINDQARFSYPGLLAIDAADRLYLMDTDGSLRLGVPYSAAPVITSQPVAQSAYPGDSVQFSVTAEGSPAPTYEWYCSTTKIAGATAATLVLNGVQPSNAGSYWVNVTNSAGTVRSAAATLTVLTRTPVPSGSGGSRGGGGGAPTLWFLSGLLGAWLARCRRQSKTSALPGREPVG
ncbi:MAG TPA: immunoglobulin domain-containing protein [Lacunisphaera sp.]|nr:immunoglobulin domain-containing protein [Lacunisphaera sp.]